MYSILIMRQLVSMVYIITILHYNKYWYWHVHHVHTKTYTLIINSLEIWNLKWVWDPQTSYYYCNSFSTQAMAAGNKTNIANN